MKNNIALEIMKELFAPKTGQYDLRNNNSFQRRKVSSVWRDTESVFYLGQAMWDLIPKFRILSNSESNGGSLKDVHEEYAKYILGRLDLC